MVTKTRQIKPVVKQSKTKLQLARLLDFARPVHTSMRFPKKFKGGVIRDKEGSPRYFLFDTSAFGSYFASLMKHTRRMFLMRHMKKITLSDG